MEDESQYESPIGPLQPRKPEDQPAIDLLTGQINSELSEVLYYDSNEKKITDASIRKQLRLSLSENFLSDKKVIKILRDEVLREIMNEFTALRKAIESMPKDIEKYNDMVMILLFKAIIDANKKNLTNINSTAELKAKMIRLFLINS